MNSSDENRLTIALDARWIFDRISGVGRVTENLLKNLPRVDNRNRYIFVFDDEERMERIARQCGLDEFENVEKLFVPFGIFSVRNQMRLPGLLKKLGADIFHSTNFMIPLRRCRPKVIVTIHDLIPLIHPELTPRSKKTRLFGLYRCIMRRIAKIADVIIADSKNTERDIEENLPMAQGKTRVVPCGIAERYFAGGGEGGEDFLRKRYGIEGDIVITAGRADPYKNTIGLVRAFEMLVAENEVEANLVIVGEEDERYPEARQYVKDNNLSEHVTFTGYLDERELVRAYASADIMVHPSLYEGFGLPPLEAMAAGTPVISSNAASLPEVLGDAAMFINPTDTKGMAKAMADLLADEDMRSKMSEKGREWAMRYKWETAAEETVRVYEEAVKGR